MLSGTMGKIINLRSSPVIGVFQATHGTTGLDRFCEGTMAVLVYRERLRERARVAARKAIEEGELIKQPCEICGTTKNIHAHHESYAKKDWLNILWLCAEHHSLRHNNRPRPRQRYEKNQPMPPEGPLLVGRLSYGD